MVQRAPIYFESHVTFADSLFDCIISYRIPNSSLIFTKNNGSYLTGFGLTIEIYNDEKFVKRVFINSKLQEDDYTETTNKNNYEQGLLKFKLSNGIYKLKPLLILNNTDREIHIKPINLIVDSNQVYRPYYVQSEQSEKNFKLINFKNSILFSEEKTDMLIPVYDNSITELNIRITQNGKNVFEKKLTDKIKLDVLSVDKKNKSIIFPKNTKSGSNYFFIKNIGNKLLEGNVEVIFTINGSEYKYISDVFWKDKPKSLTKIEEAIEYLNLIGYNKSADSLLSLNEDLQYNALYRFWKKFDLDDSSAFSNVFNEFYSRIDYIQKEFHSLGKNDGTETDRGIVYLIYGKPDKVERKFNDVYDILEIWDYISIDKKIYFSDKTGTGNFKRIK